jgi:hypothetical protein
MEEKLRNDNQKYNEFSHTRVYFQNQVSYMFQLILSNHQTITKLEGMLAAA